MLEAELVAGHSMLDLNETKKTDEDESGTRKDARRSNQMVSRRDGF